MLGDWWKDVRTTFICVKDLYSQHLYADNYCYNLMVTAFVMAGLFGASLFNIAIS